MLLGMILKQKMILMSVKKMLLIKWSVLKIIMYLTMEIQVILKEILSLFLLVIEKKVNISFLNYN
jgi:hypothetical protein